MILKCRDRKQQIINSIKVGYIVQFYILLSAILILDKIIESGFGTMGMQDIFETDWLVKL